MAKSLKKGETFHVSLYVDLSLPLSQTPHGKLVTLLKSGFGSEPLERKCLGEAEQ